MNITFVTLPANCCDNKRASALGAHPSLPLLRVRGDSVLEPFGCCPLDFSNVARCVESHHGPRGELASPEIPSFGGKALRRPERSVVLWVPNTCSQPTNNDCLVQQRPVLHSSNTSLKVLKTCTFCERKVPEIGSSPTSQWLEQP